MGRSAQPRKIDPAPPAGGALAPAAHARSGDAPSPWVIDHSIRRADDRPTTDAMSPPASPKDADGKPPPRSKLA